jgi:tetratricopeptide (TPR) repeat protein
MKLLRNAAVLIFCSQQLLFSVQNSYAASNCGPVPLPGTVALYDYLDPDPGIRWNINDINENHFARIEYRLGNGQIQHALAEIYFILLRIPNHYATLQVLGKIEKDYPGLLYEPALAGYTERLAFMPTADCYFDRAFRFRPNDHNLRLLYGIYFHRIGKFDSALEQYKIAESMYEDSSEVHYNLGLVYFELEQYELAARHAQSAYKLGYPLYGLRDKLDAIGKWEAPVATEAE